MTPGRELDLLVEEKVMGFYWDESRCRICGWRLKGSADDGCVTDNCCQRPGPRKRADEPGHYSTDLRVAFVALGKFKHWRIETDPEDDAGLYHVDIWTESGLACTAEIPVKPESVAHAICLVALKAKGVKR